MIKTINYKGLPNCLRKYRRVRGLTQKEVAKILGLKGTSMISRWETGVCLPETVNVLRLSVLYRTLVDALFADRMRSLKDELLKKEERLKGTR